jgi:hypothetical protein
MPVCASDCLLEVTAAIAASAADITLLRSIMKCLDEKRWAAVCQRKA